MEIRSTAKFVRTAPDKVRNIVSIVKGKTVLKALAQLQFAGRYAAKPLALVIKQAVNEAKEKNTTGELRISTVRVDEGPKLKRRRIRQQGRATAILKRMCHITVILTDNTSTKSKTPNPKQKKENDEK